MKKIFQNKPLLKSIQIFLVCLVLLGGMGNVKNVEAADNDILVYYTNSPSYTSENLNFSTKIYEDELKALGFNVDIKFRANSYELTDGTINLSDYGQVWIIDACTGYSFEQEELSAIETFRDHGGGLLLSVDNSGCQERVNPITAKFNNDVNMFYGVQGTGGKCISPSFIWTGHPIKHPLYSDLSNLSSTSSDACFNIQNGNIKVTVKDNDIDNSCDGDSDDDIYGAVLDECGKGRIVFDSSFVRFLTFEDGTCSDESQYQENIAEWLAVSSPCSSCTLTATPTSIDLGDSSTLTWTTENTDSARIDNNIGDPAITSVSLPDSNISVTPASAVTYTMTVTNTAGDTGTCSATVGVKIPPDTTGGLIPCGRLMDDCSTPWDERADCNLCHFIIMVKLIIDFLLKIAVVVGALFVALGGIIYIFALGDTGKMALAKRTVSLALYGFAIIFASWIIVNTIAVAFGYVDPFNSGGKWHKISCDVPMRTCRP